MVLKSRSVVTMAGAKADILVHYSTQKEMAFIALEWCYQDLRKSGRGKIKFDKKRKDRSEETLLVCVFFSAIRPHAFTELFFLLS